MVDSHLTVLRSRDRTPWDDAFVIKVKIVLTQITATIRYFTQRWTSRVTVE